MSHENPTCDKMIWNFNVDDDSLQGKKSSTSILGTAHEEIEEVLQGETQ